MDEDLKGKVEVGVILLAKKIHVRTKQGDGSINHLTSRCFQFPSHRMLTMAAVIGNYYDYDNGSPSSYLSCRLNSHL